MKRFLLSMLLIVLLCLSGCREKTDYTGYYNYTGEDTGYSAYKVSIHITQDEKGVYNIDIKDGDYATDITMPGTLLEFGNKYRGSITYDGEFRQGKIYSFVAGPSEFPDLVSFYDGDILVDLQFDGNRLLYRNSKSLGITDKDKFEDSPFIECEKVVAD